MSRSNDSRLPIILNPETLGWIAARLERDWPHMRPAERRSVLELEPEWVKLAGVRLADPYLGRQPADPNEEYVPGRNVAVDVLAECAADLRESWPHMRRDTREYYARQMPEIFEASGLQIDAPYVGARKERVDPGEDDIVEFYRKTLEEDPGLLDL